MAPEGVLPEKLRKQIEAGETDMPTDNEGEKDPDVAALEEADE